MWYRQLEWIAALGLTLLAASAQAQEFSYTLHDLGTLHSTGRKRSAEALCAIAYSPDGKTLVSAGKGGFDFWNADTGKPDRPPIRTEHGTGVAFSPDGKSLYTADGAGQLLRWDVPKRQIAFRFPQVYANIERINLSGDGSTLVSTDEQHTTFWDARTGKLLHVWKERPMGAFRSMRYYRTHHRFAEFVDDVRQFEQCQLSLSPDGLWCAYPRDGLWFEVRSTKSDRVKHHWPRGTIASIDIAPDGKTYAISPRDGAITVVTSETLNPLLTLKSPCANCSVRFSPDMQTLIAHQPDVGVLAAYDLMTGKPHWHHRQAPMWRSTALAFSPDGRHLATGDSDRRIRVYDLRTGRIVPHDRGPDQCSRYTDNACARRPAAARTHAARFAALLASQRITYGLVSQRR